MNIDLIPNGAIKRVHVSQNDVGRTLTFELFNNSARYNIPSGAVIKIQGTKPSGFGFSETCSVNGNVVTVDTTSGMTDEHGYIDTELQIKYNGNTIGTSNFVLAIEKNPHPDTITDGSTATIIPELTLLVNEVKGYAEEIEGTYHAYGSPWVASTVAEMTDTDKIYVYTGSETGYVNGNWYYYNGSSWVSGGVYNAVAVNTDTTLTQSGVSADAKVTGDELNELIKNVFDKIVFSSSDFQQGWWGVSGGGYDANHNNAICTIDYIPVDVSVISCDTSHKMRLQAWEGSAYMGAWNGSLFTTTNPNYYGTRFYLSEILKTFPTYRFKIVLYNQDGTSAITTSDASSFYSLTPNLTYAVDSYKNMSVLPIWRNGSAYNPNNTTGFAFEDIAPNLGATGFTVYIAKPLTTGHKYRYQISTYTQSSGKTQYNSNRIVADKNFMTTSQFLSFDLENSQGFCVAIYEFDENDTAVPLRVETFPTDMITIIRTFDESKLSVEDFVIDSSFVKTSLRGTDYIGQITGTQGFCKYNNYYYSSSGAGTLYKQDSSLSAVSSASLALGHCNTLQLGHNGKAYASGWDDQTVYVVDLETMTIDSSITLPTTGYTTVAVDDIGGLMYIFQRETQPSTEEAYNFITYDFVNGNVISTRKTGVAFGAMQGLDYCNGRIFVANGLGTNAIPNGFRVYDTNGNVLSEYVLNSVSDKEPQGVFVDRSTFDIYIKIDGTSLRKVAFY